VALFLASLRKDLARRLADPFALLLWVGMPLVLGTLIALVSGGGAPPRIALLVCDRDDSDVSRLLVKLLTGAGGADVPIDARAVELEPGRAAIGAGEASALVVLPEGFADALLGRGEARVELVTNPAQRILPGLIEQALQAGVDLVFYAQRLLGPELDVLRAQIDADRGPTRAEVLAVSSAVHDAIESLQTVLLPPVLELEVGPLVEPAPGAVPESEPRRVLEVPADLTARALAGETTTLHLRRASEGFSANFDDVRVGRALYTVLLDLAVLRAEGEPIEPAAFAHLREAPRALALDVHSAGARRRPPTGKQQSIPGTMVMFTLILLLTGGSVPVVLERRAGLLRRLASTPIARGEVVAGRWLSNFVLGLIQLAWALVIGTLLFDMDWGPHPVAVALVLVPWAGLCSGFALVLSSLARTEGQVVGIGVLASNLLAALGGCWWPIEIAPGWMQGLARLLPTGWIMEALHALINFQRAPASVWPQALALALAALLVTSIGARLFRYE